MATETVRNVELLTTPLFQKNIDEGRYSINGCLKVLRFLLFLDACHDFLESSLRNKRWAENTDKYGKNLKDLAHEKLLNNLRTDLIWIDNIVPYPTWTKKDLQIHALIYKLLELAQTKSNVSSKKNIKSKFVDHIQRIVNIKNIDISKYVQDFTNIQYSDFILPLLEPTQYHDKIFVGVDADYYSGNYIPLFRSLADVIERPNTDIKLFTSPATSYDAAREGLVTTQIGQMLKNKGKDLITIGDKHHGNYKIQLTVNEYVIASVTYGLGLSISGEKVNSYDSITIDKFFSKDGIITPLGINSNTNSVKYLVDKFNPDDDDIFLFKTFGDFGQILSFRSESQLIQGYVSIFISFDFLSATISSLFNKSTILESLDSGVNNLSIYTLDPSIIDMHHKKLQELGLGGVTAVHLLTGLSKIPATSRLNTKTKSRLPGKTAGLKRLRTDPDFRAAIDMLDFSENPSKKSLTAARFGKKNKLNSTSNKGLMTKLKSVGIKITRKKGKRRVYLSRSELIKRATAFRNLQLRAKKLKVRIMYKNRKGKYVYKTAKRLMNDIKRKRKTKTKPKKKVLNTRFGG